MNKWAFKGFKETYKRFGIKFEKEYYESKTYTKGKEIIQENQKKGIFKKDDSGATLIDLGEKLGEKILLRADGTSLYITQDLYLAQLKHDDFKYHKSIYVVGNEQNYHFQVLFKILKLLKYPFADNCFHLSYGMVNLPEGKMKSREGTTVDADNLMDNLENIALKEIQERDIAKRQKSLAKKISLSALKYYLLKYSAHKDFTFNPKESVSFEGDTGPYIQYTFVRATKILKRMRLNHKNVSYNKLTKTQELNLIKKMADFPEILEKSSKQLSPHVLAEYTYQLASQFNQFYEHCPVIKEPNIYTLHTRLYLVQSYAIILKKALNLLGIEVVEEM
jgi:arginyl-tRNA synthetase